MKLNKNTFNPKLHKVTLRGSPVNVIGFSLCEQYAFYIVDSFNIKTDSVDIFEVTEIKRFRVSMLTTGNLMLATSSNGRHEHHPMFGKWLTDWIEY